MRQRAMVIVLTAACAVPLSAGPPALRPGLYDVYSEMSMPGRSAPMPGRKDVHCYTTKDFDNLAQLLTGKGTQRCKVLGSNTNGATSKFTTECTQTDGTVLTSSIDLEVLSAESFRAVVRTTANGGRDANPLFQNVTVTMTAKRTGDCSTSR